MNPLFPSLEAISFQNGSGLAKGLTDLFQACIDFKSSTSPDPTARSKAMNDYIKNKLVPNMKSVIKTHTGLTCSKVILSKRLNFGYATVMDLGDKYGLNAAKFIDSYCGTGYQEVLEYVLKSNDLRCTTVDDIRKVVASLDKMTGKYKVDTLYDGKKITFTLYFDPYSAFMIKEFGHAKCQEFDAKELAAIVVHEIGHLHSLLEHALDGCLRMAVVTAAFEYFKEHASVEEKAKLVQSDPSVGKATAQKITDAVIEYKTTAGGVIHDGFKMLFDLLSAVQLIFLPLDIIGRWLIVAFNSSYYSELTNASSKNSDFATNITNFRRCERLSDQYVVRHGLGPALISGLGKFEHNIVGLGDGRISCKNSSLVWYMAMIPWFISRLCIGDGYISDEHDPQLLRAKMVVNDLLSVFKNDLSPDMLEFYVQNYEEAKVAISNTPTGVKVTEGLETFHRMLDYIAATPFAMLFTGRFSKEYERLMYKAQELVNNVLYYRAAKLQQLYNKLNLK